ncbi:hypothetical protein VIBRN418_10898 [Vibrio sp. N418]|uniref:hypothetical protein n=1 Tax=Vibrio sp. (strain N418) TaxID=701176 RepID=UPI00021C0730|nr:hypothetical protein [Vibrio sp. N418]EGU32985.1 hypothetical protein VIBRN418_10898 [Vibrio sp. N418]
MKYFSTILALLLLSACSSSPYTYYVEPTPLKAEQTKYRLADVSVDLQLGHGALEGDESFANSEKLAQQFRSYLEQYMSENNILAGKNDHSPEVDIEIDYLRTFNYGGESLNKPEVAHSIVIYQDDNKLASFATGKYTTKYGYFDEIAVNIEISAFSWDSEDEPRDIELIAELIAKDLANVGS